MRLFNGTRMANYSRTERKIALLIEKFPKLRLGAKNIYQFIWACVASVHQSFGGKNVSHTGLVKEITRVATDECFFGYFDSSPWSADGNELIVNVPKYS